MRPEPDPVPPAGGTGVLGYAWLAPAGLAVLAGAFSFAVPQLGGPGRSMVPWVGAVALWLPVLLALAVGIYRVTVTPEGALVIRTLVRSRRYDLTQLAQVTGWTWSVDRADVAAGRPRLGCWNLGLRLRDGRRLFWSPTNARDMAYGLGVIADPRVVHTSPLPIVYDDPVLRRPSRRVRTALVYAAHLAVVLVTIAMVPAVAVAADATVGPVPDPRVFPQPCALLDGLDLAAPEPLGPADDPVAWHGCGSGERRDIWLAVNPSVHAAARTVRHWLETNDEVAVAPITDPALLADLEVNFAQLVLFDGGERVMVAYLASEVSGIASVTGDATGGAGRPLSEAERFDAALALVRAVTTSPQGNEPVRSLRGDGADGGTRDGVVEAAREVHADVDQLDAWLTAIGRGR